MPLSTSSILLNRLAQVHVLSPAQLDEAGTLLSHSTGARAFCQELVRRGWLTVFQATRILAGKGQELILGPYLLLEPIGKGGYGQIFKARHQKMNRVVAVKVLRSDVLGDHEAVQRFYREIEVASRLSHPHIVHAYEAGSIGGNLVLVMELVEGLNLEELVHKDGPLAMRQGCEYVRQTAAGLQYAHECGLIHPDIKPSNLLVGPDESHGWGTIKILDLGLARFQAPPKESKTSHLTVLGSSSVTQGSPDYMSPEQALDFHLADIRSDIYSLGCTLHFLLAGRPPFSGGTLAEKLMKHQQAEPPVDQLVDVPERLKAILQKMLAKSPEDRYQTPAEIVDELAPFCRSSDAISAGKETVDARAPNLKTVPEAAALEHQPGGFSKRKVLYLFLGTVGLGCLMYLGLASLSEPIGDTTRVASGRVVGETGTVTVKQSGPNDWHMVKLARTYHDPVVVMGPPSSIGTQPITIRVRKVASMGFEFQMDEWDYLEGRHQEETIGYLVVERGEHWLDQDIALVAGQVIISNQWKTVPLPGSFLEAPVVLSQVTSTNESSAVVARLQSVSTRGFQIRLQEEEAADGKHAPETVNWLALTTGTGIMAAGRFEVGRTDKLVDHTPAKVTFDQAYSSPIILASIQTFAGRDAAGMRYVSVSDSHISIRIEEEQSKDKETHHAPEVVGYAVFEKGLIHAR